LSAFPEPARLMRSGGLVEGKKTKIMTKHKRQNP